MALGELDSIILMNKTKSIELSLDERNYLLSVVKRRTIAHLVAQRANALLLLDEGLSFDDVARVLYLDQASIRKWVKLHSAKGNDFLALSEYKKREGHLSFVQEQALKKYFSNHHAMTTNEVRDYVLSKYDKLYSRSGSIKLMERLGFIFKKPRHLAKVSDVVVQVKFIADYTALQNRMEADEAICFADAVHPSHQSKPARGWFLKEDRPAIHACTGRKRLNIHGALDLETFKMQFVEVQTIDANSTKSLLEKIEFAHKNKRVIHVFLDNARYHHAKLLKGWLNLPQRRVKLHFIPPYCPHLNPIERLWAVMHKQVTHNKHYAKYNDFANAILDF